MLRHRGSRTTSTKRPPVSQARAANARGQPQDGHGPAFERSRLEREARANELGRIADARRALGTTARRDMQWKRDEGRRCPSPREADGLRDQGCGDPPPAVARRHEEAHDRPRSSGSVDGATDQRSSRDSNSAMGPRLSQPAGSGPALASNAAGGSADIRCRSAASRSPTGCASKSRGEWRNHMHQHAAEVRPDDSNRATTGQSAAVAISIWTPPRGPVPACSRSSAALRSFTGAPSSCAAGPRQCPIKRPGRRRSVRSTQNGRRDLCSVGASCKKSKRLTLLTTALSGF